MLGHPKDEVPDSEAQTRFHPMETVAGVVPVISEDKAPAVVGPLIDVHARLRGKALDEALRFEELLRGEFARLTSRCHRTAWL